MTQIDTDKLRALIAKATDSNLSDGGRYFHEDCNDLTQCGHGDTGEYRNRADGKLVEWLWNNRIFILTMAEDRKRDHDEINLKADFISKTLNQLAAMDEENAKLREALERQTENIAWILNHATFPDQWYCKFSRELEEDRVALGKVNS